MKPKTPRQDAEKPLVDDIRLLGRVLGDVIRTQEEIRADTLEQQKKRAREALEGL